MTEPDTTLRDTTVRDLIDGTWSTPSVELDGWLEDPTTGKRRGPQLATHDAAVDAALAAAAREHDAGALTALSPDERADLLEAVASALEPRSAAIAAAESAATGAVIGITSMLAFIVHASFRLAAAQLREGATLQVLTADSGRPVEVHRRPWGPALSLVPWNAPAPMAAHKVANSLAAGCPSILKVSELAPDGSQILADVVGEVVADAGLPGGAFQFVHGGPSVGGRLVTDPRVRAVSFTGGLRGGREIAAACAADLKPTQLELGGNNALVLLDDVDTETAAAAVVALLTTLNGQWCRALGRLLLPASRADELLEAALAALAEVRVGDPLDAGSDMGPIVHSGHVARLRSALDRYAAAGGAAHAPTPVPDTPGNWLAPTLVTGLDAAVTVDEVFGPIAAVHTYGSDDEAVALANGTPFGLEGYVFGADEERALAVARRVRAGGVKVNGATVMSLHLFAPRPAWGLSGFAEEGTAETLRFFCGAQVVGVEEIPAFFGTGGGT